MTTNSTPFLTPEAFLATWQGHRGLTRRLIEAYPEDQLFTFSLGGMRTFGELALELLTMAEPMVRGIVTGAWDQNMDRAPRPKAEILRQWDEWPGPVYTLLMYVHDNEIHHRGQAYVYLRALGVQPPPFPER
jgi:uncharacterized damage-inducible protein DinB